MPQKVDYFHYVVAGTKWKCSHCCKTCDSEQEAAACEAVHRAKYVGIRLSEIPAEIEYHERAIKDLQDELSRLKEGG